MPSSSGFGLRAEKNLDPGELIYEYVGEVVGEQQFRKRMSRGKLSFLKPLVLTVGTTAAFARTLDLGRAVDTV
jgi:hypothetical protein